MMFRDSALPDSGSDDGSSHDHRMGAMASGPGDTRGALLLDLDGTLADSLSVMRLVYGRFLRELGTDPTDEEFSTLNGPPLIDVVRLIRKTHRIKTGVTTLLIRYQELIDEAYTRVKPALGARELLRQARVSGLVVGVVTSNSTSRTRAWLERADLNSYVDVIVGGEDVQQGKPSPEPYKLAIALARCSAMASIAVEDSLLGARAAVDAGLRTFVLSCDSSTAQLPKGAKHIFSLVQLADMLRSGLLL